MEAVVDGYTEAIALDTYGNLSEGSGQNVFVVRDGVITTPPIGNSVLAGITRDCVITLARDLGIEVREQTLPREALYVADEVFFVGTAVEVTPIRSIDRIPVGPGKRGPITERIQQQFFQIVRGEAPDTHGWLQFVPVPAGATWGGTAGR
jgi:branched-chain amino acid aminotransferase